MDPRIRIHPKNFLDPEQWLILSFHFLSFLLYHLGDAWFVVTSCARIVLPSRVGTVGGACALQVKTSASGGKFQQFLHHFLMDGIDQTTGLITVTSIDLQNMPCHENSQIIFNSVFLTLDPGSGAFLTPLIRIG
jgi:hypothetical protein